MANKNRGFIKIYRSIDEHWIWKDKPFSKGQAFIDLILQANHKGEKFEYKGEIVEGERGKIYRSVTYFAERWGWSRWRTTRFFSALENDGMLHMERTCNRTVLTLINYDDFQDGRTSNLSANQQQTDSKPTEDQQQTDTYKNVKNDKEVKNVKNKKTAAPLSPNAGKPKYHIIDEYEYWYEDGMWCRELINKGDANGDISG